MSICPNCDKKINTGTGNKRKVHGVTMHKLCPGKKSNRKKKKEAK